MFALKCEHYSDLSWSSLSLSPTHSSLSLSMLRRNVIVIEQQQQQKKKESGGVVWGFY